MPRSGLYDERMGPVELMGTCQTCALRYASCPGHPGHIELDVPVYYPVLFPALFQLLRCKCLYCHKLRMSQTKVRYFLVKLKLLEIGDVAAALGLQDALAPLGPLHEENADHELGRGKGGQSRDAEQILRRHESRYTAFVTTASSLQKVGSSPILQLGNDPYTRSLQAGVIETFHRAALAVKGCENCGAHSPPLRKDGFTKIFQRPTPKRLRAIMLAKKLKLRTGMEVLRKMGIDPPSAGLGWGRGDSWLFGSADVKIAHCSLSGLDDSDDSIIDMDVDPDEIEAADSDSDQGEPGNDDFGEADRYLVPVEVEAQMRLLWRQGACSELLDFIWLRALHGSAAPLMTLRSHSHVDLKKDLGEGGGGWRVFFSRVVLVPPSRFRPPGKVGDIVAEHPQNTYLKKVLIENKIIRDLYVPKVAGIEEGVQGLRGDENGSDGIAAEAGACGAVDISKVVSHWIELQGAVNCFMDSAKDGNVLAQTGPAGIRQLLERKEGLFRRHMMGKRVNFCCRSVISPDPYIGTNEIGIPVHFAKSLHYPTPVNIWNVKYLRTLVQRGPFRYPGECQEINPKFVHHSELVSEDNKSPIEFYHENHHPLRLTIFQCYARMLLIPCIVCILCIRVMLLVCPAILWRIWTGP
jgi:DNA-directed RNA polymerase I subunit RPA1